MSFERLHKLVAYLISGLGLTALSLGSELPAGVKLLLALGYVLSFFAEGRILSRPAWIRGWTAAVVAVLGVQLMRAVLVQPTLAMAVEFAAFVQISRLFNRRSAVDYQQIAVLAFLHLIAATVLSNDLSYAFVFVGFVVVTPWMLAISHLRREIEGRPSDDPAHAARVRRVLASRRVVGSRFLMGTALLSLPLFGLTITLFVLMPRVGKGLFDVHRGGGQSVAGFGEQVELGGFGVIRDDPTVVLRVTPLPRVDRKAARVTLRLRGTSFDHYDGRRWSRTTTERRRIRPTGDYYPLHGWPRPRRDRRMRIVLEPFDQPVLFLPRGTIGIRVPARAGEAMPRSRTLSRGAGLDIRYGEPSALGLVYVAYVAADEARLQRDALRQEERARYLQLPPGHERVAALAHRLVGEATAAREKAERILRYLRDSDTLRYSLQQPRLHGKVPLAAFLFDAKRGHCEYFSTAMAVMLRAVGVPARNVTGFVGGRYNAYGEYYALRQGDAHSWVEAFVPGEGWVTYDPTPSGPMRAAGADGPLDALRALLDALRTEWATSVLAYDLHSQLGLFREIGRWAQALGGTEESSPDAGGYETQPSGDLASWRIGLVAGVLGLLGSMWVLWLRRRRPNGRARPRGRGPEAAIFHSLDRALARKGLARPSHRTPREHAHWVRAQGFPDSDAVDAVTERYLEARYGARALAPDEATRLRALVHRVRRSDTRDAASARHGV